MARWTAADIPSQAGRSAIVTGTGGIGFECALVMARSGAEVIVAGRNPDKGAEAVSRIRSGAAGADVRFETVDLASLNSISAFCARLRDQRDRVDVLVNNAGLMTPPVRRETEDGFEVQLGVNHLGHFALTAGLMPLLRRSGGARVVSLSSVAAREGRIDFDDLQAERAYRPMPAYAQSKLACLMFALELQRRSEAHGWGVASIAAHPGVSRTDLLHNAPGRWSAAGLARSLLPFLFQPAPQGALPVLYAAISPEAKPGGYFGPDRMSETRGYPAPAKVPPRALVAADAERLWRESERLTGCSFEAGPA